MASGMEMMLKSMGVNVPELTQNFKQLLSFAESVDKRLAQIQEGQRQLSARLDALEMVAEDGNSGNTDAN